MNLNVSSVTGGGIPNSLSIVEQLTSASLFERRLDVFLPLILVASICCLALVFGLACIKAKTRTSATWDPPAGIIFGQVQCNHTSQ